MSATAVPLRPLRKGSVLRLWLALGLLGLIAAGIAWAGTTGLGYATTESGLQYRVIEAGEGPNPTVDDIALVEYTGRLPDGSVFDTTEGRQPAPFPVAPEATIPGFSEGLRLMRKGAIYEFRIPPALAYGERGVPDAIPPNTTLHFRVQLLEFVPQAALRGMMQGAPQGHPGGDPHSPEEPRR